MKNPTTLAAVAAIALFAAACGNSTGPEPAHGTDNFNGNTLSSYNSFIDAGVASWAVASGELVGSGVAEQAVLVRSGVSFTDGWVETASTRADDGGLVLRFASPTNYYLLAFRDDSAAFPRSVENLALYHHDGTAYNEIWHTDVAWPRGTRHVIRFEAAGPRLRVYFDGTQQADLAPSAAINDRNPWLGAGGPGVRHFGFAPTWITRFESFTWQSTDPL